MNKALAVVLALAVLSMVMLGCSSTPDNNQESDVSAGDSQTPSVDGDVSEDDVESSVDQDWQNGSDSVEIGSMI
ncbi:MAG: hypothetical protein ACQESE_02115 [Nanobdellota archaeon]